MKPRTASTVLLLSVATLLAIGLVAIYSVGITQSSVADKFGKQVVWAGLGLVAFTLCASLRYEWLRRYAFVALAFSILLLAAVATPGIGSIHNKARRWFDLGPLRFQPSELAKLTVILATALYAEKFHRQMRTWRHGAFWPGVMLAVVGGLIAIEPDRGTALLIGAVTGVMLVVAGIRWSIVWSTLTLGITGAVAYGIHDPLVRRRFDAWWNLEYYKDDLAYQAGQAMIAFGQGGVFGLGLGNGLQKRGFVPENHTDFILSIIGEEMGLVGAVLVVLLFVCVVWSGFSIARHAGDYFGMLTAVGLTSLIGLQAVINIGVVTSAFPCKGVALPFVSYGGSSLIMMLAATGLLCNVARHAQSVAADDSGGFEDDEAPFAQPS